MNGEQYRWALERLGLTIVGAAPYLGISRRHSQRIAADEIEVPAPVAKLLRVAIAHKVTKEELADDSKIQVRGAGRRSSSRR